MPQCAQHTWSLRADWEVGDLRACPECGRVLMIAQVPVDPLSWQARWVETDLVVRQTGPTFVVDSSDNTVRKYPVKTDSDL